MKNGGKNVIFFAISSYTSFWLKAKLRFLPKSFWGPFQTQLACIPLTHPLYTALETFSVSYNLTPQPDFTCLKLGPRYNISLGAGSFSVNFGWLLLTLAQSFTTFKKSVSLSYKQKQNLISLSQFILTRMAIITNVGEDVEKLETSTLLVGTKHGADALENILALHQKAKHVATMWSGNFTPRYPRELQIGIHTKICTWIFIAALFITPKRRNIPEHPSIDEWINKMYFHTKEYYLATYGNVIWLIWTLKVFRKSMENPNKI